MAFAINKFACEKRKCKFSIMKKHRKNMFYVTFFYFFTIQENPSLILISLSYRTHTKNFKFLMEYALKFYSFKCNDFAKKLKLRKCSLKNTKL